MSNQVHLLGQMSRIFQLKADDEHLRLQLAPEEIKGSEPKVSGSCVPKETAVAQEAKVY